MPNDQLHVDSRNSVAAARADFEVFALGRNLARACDNAENYASPYVQNDWEVWKASLGATAASATRAPADGLRSVPPHTAKLHVSNEQLQRVIFDLARRSLTPPVTPAAMVLIDELIDCIPGPGKFSDQLRQLRHSVHMAEAARHRKLGTLTPRRPS